MHIRCSTVGMQIEKCLHPEESLFPPLIDSHYNILKELHTQHE